MNRTEALEHFEKNYVQNRLEEKILQAQSCLLQHRDELVKEFRESLRAVCRRIKVMQEAGKLDKVGFITYAMLRSAILAKQSRYRIDVYNKEWYFDTAQPECSGTYDGSRIFSWLDELELELTESGKLYLHQVTPVDLEKIKLREAAKFNQLIIHLADYALHQEESLAELAEIAKEDEFEIRVGEYYDVTEVVYKEDRHSKDPEATKEWLEDRHENQYGAAVFSNLNLSGGNYRELNLWRADFSGSNLTGSNFANSMLIKTRFKNCLLNWADFSNATIHDADFNGAQLIQANFFAVRGAGGIVATLAQQVYSVWGVNFSGANLTEADFRYADLRGADFRGAQLAQAKFSGAKLERAIFDKSILPTLNLDHTQTAGIIAVE
jgi:uncharacterized protein YjbI with pentapeptide repeats